MRRVVGALLVLAVVGCVGFGGGFTEWSTDGTNYYASAIVVQNVSDTVATVNVVYPTPCDPTTPDYQVTVPAGTSQLVNVNDAFPGPWNGAALVSSDQPIVATQNYVWEVPSGGAQWATHDGGVVAPAKTWYLAEGSTYAGYESYICVQNPSQQVAQVEITYMAPGSYGKGPSIAVEPVSTVEVPIRDTLVDYSSISAAVTSDVPVIAQLSTYWNGGASYASTHGVSDPATTWYLAEGNTGEWSGFDTWFVVQNPNPSAATVSVTYLTGDRQVLGPEIQVASMTHEKINVGDSLPDQPHFAAVITSDQPIVATQSMTWDGYQGFDSTVGVSEPQTSWKFPMARSHFGASSWLAVQNVGESSTIVSIDYVTQNGTTGGSTLDLAPFGRDSISLPDDVGGSMWYSAVVTSDQPIVAVAGNYWETSAGTHRDTSFGLSQTSMQWYLPITPHAPGQSSSDSADGPIVIEDRDGDGVPDDQDLCPDFPGSEAMDGC